MVLNFNDIVGQPVSTEGKTGLSLEHAGAQTTQVPGVTVTFIDNGLSIGTPVSAPGAEIA